MENYINYAKHVNANEYVLKWVNTVLKNELEREQKTTEEVEHIIDFLVQTDKKLERMSYEQAKKLADAWTKSLQKKGADILETPEDTEVVLDFGDGFKVVKLIGENAYKREGYLMRHCVGGYYGNGKEIYSLRDRDNMPHCTMERDQQVKGKGNGDIHPKYISYVVQFLEHIGMTVGDSEMSNLGYINVEKIKADLHKETVYFNDKYVREDAKLIDVDGNEYLSLDLLDIKPLIKVDSEQNLKVQFDIPALVRLSIEWLSKNKVKTESVQATSGDYSQLATSGDYSQLATSGDYSQLATSGDYSKLVASGYNSQLATSGYNSQLATSGDYSKLVASGDYSKLATSGYNSQLVASGYYSQLEIKGDYSVGANIGVNGTIKGIIGSWITLAEYDDSRKPVCVKSAQIDGKKLKADTWYKLKGGKFIEVTN